MSYYQVLDESFKKVEAFFIKKAKETGSNRIEARVIDIAEGSGVALATAHNALKAMARQKVITVVKPQSRRFPITYIYNKDIEEVEIAQSVEDQLEYLKKKVQELTAENEGYRIKCLELEGKIRAMQM